MAPSHSVTVSMEAASAPEQTRYSRFATDVTLSDPADQLRVKAVVDTPVEAEKVPAVGIVESEATVSSFDSSAISFSTVSFSAVSSSAVSSSADSDSER